MSGRVLLALLGLLLGLGAACSFEPDLSRFAACDAAGGCPTGSTCLAAENRCLPDCGEGAACPPAGGGDEPLALAQAQPAPVVEGDAVAHTFTAAGGTPPYRFEAGSPLPAGLTLTDGGVLGGRAQLDAGIHALQVRVSDQAQPPASVLRAYVLEVRPRLRLAGPGWLPIARPNQDFAETLSSTGGLAPYHYALVEGGGAPAWLALSPQGVVSGRPPADGAVVFRARVTDSASPPQAVERELRLSVVAQPVGLKLEVTTRSFPDGRVGTPYSYRLRAEGNSGEVSWNVSGNLPAGLTLNRSTGEVSGTPTGPRTVLSFGVTAEDSVGFSGQSTFSIQVD